MKKLFAKLPMTEREKVEGLYHGMKPDDLDEVMSKATRRTPSVIRLPSELVRGLKTVAESEGEPEYQDMARRWIEERLQQEISTEG